MARKSEQTKQNETTSFRPIMKWSEKKQGVETNWNDLTLNKC